MNGILSNNNTDNKLQGVLAPKSKESVETAGSLAMNVFHSLFSVNSYDEFLSSNPFMVDYSMYSDCGDTIASTGFWADFANASSILSNSGECSSVSSSGFGCSTTSSGGFTSVC